MVGQKPYYTPDEVIKQIDLLIEGLDLDAYKTNGRTQLYSGPHHDVIIRFFNEKYGKGNWQKNHLRAFRQAALEATTLIDYTEIGRFTDNLGIDDQGNILNHASKRFAEAIEGDVFTTICGSARDKIFFEVELPALVANKKVTSINGLPMDMVRMFYELDPYEAFRLICIAELREIREYSKRPDRQEHSEEYLLDHIDRHTFFGFEQSHNSKRHPRPSPDMQLWMAEIMADYSVIMMREEPAPARPTTATKAEANRIAATI